MKYPLIFLLFSTTLSGCSYFVKHPEEVETVEHIIDEVINEASDIIRESENPLVSQG